MTSGGHRVDFEIFGPGSLQRLAAPSLSRVRRGAKDWVKDWVESSLRNRLVKACFVLRKVRQHPYFPLFVRTYIGRENGSKTAPAPSPGIFFIPLFCRGRMCNGAPPVANKCAQTLKRGIVSPTKAALPTGPSFLKIAFWALKVRFFAIFAVYSWKVRFFAIFAGPRNNSQPRCGRRCGLWH